MKKLMIIHPIAWSHYRGVVFSEFYSLLRSRNIDMLVLHIALNSREREKLGEVDLSVHRYPYKILFDTLWDDTSLVRRVYKILKEVNLYKPDVIITCGYNDISYIVAIFFQKLSGRKVILEGDSTYFDRTRNFIKESIKKLIIKMIDGGFPKGKLSADYMIKLGMSKRNLFIVPHATDNQFLCKIYENSKKVRISIKAELGIKTFFNFLYVGRLSPVKNVESLIKAFSLLRQGLSNSNKWGLIIVGDGRCKEKLLSLVKSLKVDNVYFEGGKSWREIPKYYAIGDVFVLPSISEPWGLVVNEAMICGLPVIVSDRCGSSYDLVEEGKNGFIINPFNTEELVNIMAKFVNEEVEIKNMGISSKEIIQTYTPENAAKQMLKGIESLLGNCDENT